MIFNIKNNKNDKWKQIGARFARPCEGIDLSGRIDQIFRRAKRAEHNVQLDRVLTY